MVAFLALVPFGLALRERLGSAGQRPDLISAAFLIAAIVGLEGLEGVEWVDLASVERCAALYVAVAESFCA